MPCIKQLDEEGIKVEIKTVRLAIKEFPATKVQRHKMSQTQEHKLGYLQGLSIGLSYLILYNKEVNLIFSFKEAADE